MSRSQNPGLAEGCCFPELLRRPLRRGVSSYPDTHYLVGLQLASGLEASRRVTPPDPQAPFKNSPVGEEEHPGRIGQAWSGGDGRERA